MVGGGPVCGEGAMQTMQSSGGMEGREVVCFY